MSKESELRLTTTISAGNYVRTVERNGTSTNMKFTDFVAGMVPLLKANGLIFSATGGDCDCSAYVPLAGNVSMTGNLDLFSLSVQGSSPVIDEIAKSAGGSDDNILITKGYADETYTGGGGVPSDLTLDSLRFNSNLNIIIDEILATSDGTFKLTTSDYTDANYLSLTGGTVSGTAEINTLKLSNTSALVTDIVEGSGSDNDKLITKGYADETYGGGGGSGNLPVGYKQGLTTTWLNINLTQVNAGVARSANNGGDISNSAPISKAINVPWSEGSGQGGFPSGITLTPTTWYQFFIIAKPDGTTDAGFDTSNTASNLLADATGYSLFRRVAWIRTDGLSQIVKYYQDYNDFTWALPFEDYAPNYQFGTVTDTTPFTTLASFTVPPNSRAFIRCIVTAGLQGSAGSSRYDSVPTYLTDFNYLISNNNLYSFYTHGSGSFIVDSNSQFRILVTTASNQPEVVATSEGVFSVGWNDLFTVLI